MAWLGLAWLGLAGLGLAGLGWAGLSAIAGSSSGPDGSSVPNATGRKPLRRGRSFADHGGMNKVFLDPQRRLRNGWKALAFVLVLASLLTPLMLVLHHLPTPLQHWVPKVALIDACVLLATWICVRAEGQTLASAGWNPGWTSGGQLLLGLAGGVGLLLLSALLVWLGDGVHLVRVPVDTAWNVLRGAGVMLGVGVMEELGYRGYPLQRAIRGMGVRSAMVLLAILFCLSHPLDMTMSVGVMVVTMLNLFVFGLVESLLWWRTGSLAASIGMHMGWNWMQQTLGFGVSGIESRGWWTPVFHGAPDWLTGGAFGLEASIAATIVLALALVGLIARRPSAGARAHLPSNAVLG